MAAAVEMEDQGSKAKKARHDFRRMPTRQEKRRQFFWKKDALSKAEKSKATKERRRIRDQERSELRNERFRQAKAKAGASRM
jgi:hypothetical protein